MDTPTPHDEPPRSQATAPAAARTAPTQAPTPAAPPAAPQPGVTQGPADGYLLPRSLPTGATQGDRLAWISATFGPKLGTRRVFARQTDGGAFLLLSADPGSQPGGAHRYHAEGHPLAGQDRYEWVYDPDTGAWRGVLTADALADGLVGLPGLPAASPPPGGPPSTHVRAAADPRFKARLDRVKGRHKALADKSRGEGLTPDEAGEYERLDVAIKTFEQSQPGGGA